MKNCPFAGGLEGVPSGKARAEGIWVGCLILSVALWGFSGQDLQALHLSLPKPGMMLSELELVGCSPVCGITGEGSGQSPVPGRTSPIAHCHPGDNDPAVLLPSTALTELLAKDSPVLSKAGLAQGAWDAVAAH